MCGFLFSFFCFLGPYLWHIEVPGLGSNRSCSHWPTAQPQQCQIWAASSNYNTAHSNARSLTHWERPGVEPTSSWILVGFVTTQPQWELQILHCFGLGNGSLNLTPKAQIIKFLKIVKNFWAKDAIKKMKRQPTEWKKIFGGVPIMAQW